MNILLPLKKAVSCLNFTTFKDCGEILKNSLFRKYPFSYFSLIVKGHHLNLIHFKGEEILETKTFDLGKDNYLESLKHILSQHSNHPIHLLLQNKDIHFRLISLDSIYWWWDRKAILKQAIENEFSADYWVQKYKPLSYFKKSHRYLLAGIRPSENLKKLIQSIQNCTNPLCGIQLWTLVFVQQVFAIVHSFKKINHKWTIILHSDKPGFWEMIVCQNEKIILCRKNQAEDKLSSSSLNQEIFTTLRYLNRNDYQEGEEVTVIQIGFKEEDFLEKTNLMNVIHLAHTFNVTKRNLKYFIPWYRFWELIKKEERVAYPSFCPPNLRQHFLAFKLPHYFVKIALPVSVGIFLINLGISKKNHDAQLYYSSLLEKKMQSALPVQAQETLKESEYFDAYRKVKTNNPLPLLQRIAKILPPYSVATELNWISNEAVNGVKVLKMAVNLVINRNLLNFKNDNDKNFSKYQERVKTNLAKFNPLMKANWGKPNAQYNVSLNIEYPLLVEKE